MRTYEFTIAVDHDEYISDDTRQAIAKALQKQLNEQNAAKGLNLDGPHAHNPLFRNLRVWAKRTS
jgi:hypothetical protein